MSKVIRFNINSPNELNALFGYNHSKHFVVRKGDNLNTSMQTTQIQQFKEGSYPELVYNVTSNMLSFVCQVEDYPSYQEFYSVPKKITRRIPHKKFIVQKKC